MEIEHLKGRTYTVAGRTMMVLYRLDEHNCILIDNGFAEEGPELLTFLKEQELVPKALLCSHMHIDHHGNSRLLKETFGCPLAMPEGEAGLCCNITALRRYFDYYICDPDYRRVIDERLWCPVEIPIGAAQDKVELAGAEFKVLHLPGHSFDHCGFVTPDGIAYAADALLSEDVFARAKLPMCNDWRLDRTAKLYLKELPYTQWVFAHKGTLQGDIAPLADAQVALMDRELEAILALVNRPMTRSELDAACRTHYHMNTSDLRRMNTQKRHLRAFIEELVLRGSLIVQPGSAEFVYVRSC